MMEIRAKSVYDYRLGGAVIGCFVGPSYSVTVRQNHSLGHSLLEGITGGSQTQAVVGWVPIFPSPYVLQSLCSPIPLFFSIQTLILT